MSVFLRLWLCLLALGWLAPGHAEQPVPPLTARVTDLTGTLAPAERAELEARLAALETRKGAQIAVLIVPTTEPETIEQYARRVLDEWKLGRRGIDDGALLLVAKADRRVRIETQYGLEGVIPDAVAKRIIEEEIVPRFRAGDFAGGIRAGVERMAALVEGEPLPPPRPQRTAGPGEWLPVLAFLVLFVGRLLGSLFGQLPGAVLGAVLAGLLVWLGLGSFLLGLAAGFVVFVLLLAGRGGGGGWGSGWGGGWTSGGGGLGGGGFSGGGGLGGGGGASGRW